MKSKKYPHELRDMRERSISRPGYRGSSGLRLPRSARAKFSANFRSGCCDQPPFPHSDIADLALRSHYCALQQLTIAMQQSTYSSVFKASWRIDVKKISVSFAAVAVLAMTALTGAVAAELPSYEKAGLPVSAVQLQVLGAKNVSEQALAALSASPVQLRVLTPRYKINTAAVH
jgi:hypothetical protein